MIIWDNKCVEYVCFKWKRKGDMIFSLNPWVVFILILFGCWENYGILAVVTPEIFAGDMQDLRFYKTYWHTNL